MFGFFLFALGSRWILDLRRLWILYVFFGLPLGSRCSLNLGLFKCSLDFRCSLDCGFLICSLDVRWILDFRWIGGSWYFFGLSLEFRFLLDVRLLIVYFRFHRI